MTELNKQTDDVLIELYRKGDVAALNTILERYKPLVIKNTQEFFLTGGEKDDLIQEGMIGLFSATNDFDLDAKVNFFHFANICIRRQLIKAIEADNRKKNSPLNDYVSISFEDNSAGEELLFAHGGDPAELYIMAEDKGELLRSLQNILSDFENDVLKYYLGGFDYQEIARILNKEPKDIDNAKSRIKQKAKKIV